MIRLVFFSVLKKHASNPYFILQMTYPSDFRVHVLLVKLFDDSFINKFKARLARGKSDSHSELIKLIADQQHAIEDIRHILRTRMPCLDSLNIAQFVEHHKATPKNVHELMIMLFSVKRCQNLSLDTIFKRLMDAWPYDADRLDKLIPIACEFIRIVRRPPTVFYREAEIFLEREIVKYAVKTNRQICIELFKAVSDRISIPRFVIEHVSGMKPEDIGLEFSLAYARYIPTLCDNAERSSFRFFSNILPPTPAFHKDPTLWRREPRYFNAISCMKLREIFTEMHKDPQYPLRKKRMEKYMDMLEYDVFVSILKGFIDNSKRKSLADFMVFHMDEKRKKDYRSSLRRSRAGGPRGSKITGVWNTIKLALGASQPA
ncbi:hypothetical protein PAPHI01_1015 [Pancytospora philotis]|nr:hypothetical protein PAPHI01_1015 [Pancytospora philotis]